MKKLLRIAAFSLVFIITAAPSIYFNVMIPAIVDLPSHITSIAVIDRSQSENTMVNIVEKGLLSALSGDRDPLTNTCINGLFDELSRTGQVRPVRSNIVKKRAGTSLDFPEPLQWFEIETLCKELEVDAIIALEIFNMQILKDAAEVKAGFRLYDPVVKKVIDQHLFFNSAGWRNPSPNLEGVVMKLVSEDDAIYDASYRAGKIYAGRITPGWYRAERKYYRRSKGNDDFALGARMMEVNDWDAAIAALSTAYENSNKRKTKGRAAHNLAVVYEILGDLPLAKEWAQEAWGVHRNKASKDYVMILNRRLQELEIIRQQEAT